MSDLSIVLQIIHQCYSYISRQSLLLTKWFRVQGSGFKAFQLRISECGFRNYKEFITTNFGKLSFQPSAGAMRQGSGLKGNSDFKTQNASQKTQSSVLRPRCFKFILFLLIPCTLYLIPAILPAAYAADVTLAWDPNTEPDIAGYKLHYGTASRNYPDFADVGNTTQYTLTGLQEGLTYYFAVKAFDDSGNESGYSGEVAHTIAAQNSQPNRPTVPSGPSNGYPNTGYDFTTSASDPDGDLLDYRFDWGDGTVSAWGGASARTHSWSSSGSFCVKAQAQDPAATTSDWSQCHTINIAVNTYSITASAGAHGTISPSGNVTVNEGANQSFTITPDQGYYVSNVLVDNASVGATSLYTFNNVTQDHTITASFALNNRVPNANAGADQTKLVSDTVTLDGSGSSDADGDSLTFSWSFVSKPGGSSAALSSTAATKPTFEVDASGSYVVQLIVNDGAANSTPDTVTISTVQDSDNDGLSDKDEINIYGTDPNKMDTDGDGINDGAEITLWGNNWNLDYDGDGVVNLLDADSDGDGLSDGIEVSGGYNPADPLDVGKTSARVTNGLQVLYTFDEGSGVTVHDTSGVGTPLDLKVGSGEISWLFGGGVTITSAGLLKSAEPATKLIEACRATNEISIEAWVKPANTTQGGPARIVTLSQDPSNRNFTLAQSGDFYDIRLRTTTTGINGIPSVATPDGSLTTALTNIVYVRDSAGVVRIYVNGKQVSSETVGGDLSNWKETYRFGLANEMTMDRPWLGDLYLIAIYDRALKPEEINQNFQAGLKPDINQPPMAKCTVEQSLGGEPLQFNFSASGSTDPDGTIVLYEWDFNGDGTFDWNSPDNGDTTYTYALSNTYEVLLRVTDNRSATDTATMTITLTYDSDNDGLSDKDETNIYGTDPNKMDTDGDGINDGAEITLWGNDWNADFDQDGLINLLDPDSDNDGYPDGSSPPPPASPPALAALPVEIGEVQIDHNWQYVELKKSFREPIVIAKSISLNGGDPAVIRIRHVDENGFEIRVQEWDYLDGTHVKETVTYVVMEPGSYTLEDGTKVEAGMFETDKIKRFETVSFSQNFQEIPVVTTSIISINEADAVTGRIRNIDTRGFDFRMQEQEQNRKKHITEIVGYIAWEPSVGIIDSLTFEINKTGDSVKHKFYTIQFAQNFVNTPMFIADMQTGDGMNTANVRWQNKDAYAVEVQIDEEQSRDREIKHNSEVVGYMVFSK